VATIGAHSTPPPTAPGQDARNARGGHRDGTGNADEAPVHKGIRRIDHGAVPAPEDDLLRSSGRYGGPDHFLPKLYGLS